jgi:hypothetical protein
LDLRVDPGKLGADLDEAYQRGEAGRGNIVGSPAASFERFQSCDHSPGNLLARYELLNCLTISGYQNLGTIQEAVQHELLAIFVVQRTESVRNADGGGCVV